MLQELENPLTPAREGTYSLDQSTPLPSSQRVHAQECIAPRHHQEEDLPGIQLLGV